MNIKRGAFRLWAALSLLWALLIPVSAWAGDSTSDGYLSFISIVVLLGMGLVLVILVVMIFRPNKQRRSKK